MKYNLGPAFYCCFALFSTFSTWKYIFVEKIDNSTRTKILFSFVIQLAVVVFFFCLFSVGRKWPSATETKTFWQMTLADRELSILFIMSVSTSVPNGHSKGLTLFENFSKKETRKKPFLSLVRSTCVSVCVSNEMENRPKMSPASWHTACLFVVGIDFCCLDFGHVFFFFFFFWLLLHSPV